MPGSALPLACAIGVANCTEGLPPFSYGPRLILLAAAAVAAPWLLLAIYLRTKRPR